MACADGVAQIFIAFLVAFKERPLDLIDGHQRKIAVQRDGADQLCHGAVQQHVGQHQNFREFEMLARQHVEEIIEYADGIVAVDQRRSLRSERRCPGAENRGRNGEAGPLDRIWHEKAQAALHVVLVAHDHEADLPVVETRHGRGQETGIEEDVRLDRPVGQIFEFIQQFETGGG